MTDKVNRLGHYSHGPIEVIEVIEGFNLNFHLGNVIKYILRAEYKGDYIHDLRKAQWYLNRHIEQWEENNR